MELEHTPYQQYKDFLVAHKSVKGQDLCNHTDLCGRFGGRFFIPREDLPKFFELQSKIPEKYRTISQFATGEYRFHLDIDGGTPISNTHITYLENTTKTIMEQIYTVPKDFTINFVDDKNTEFLNKTHIISNVMVSKREYRYIIKQLKQSSPFPKGLSPEWIDTPVGLRMCGNYKSKEGEKNKVADLGKGKYGSGILTPRMLSSRSIYPLTDEHPFQFTFEYLEYGKKKEIDEKEKATKRKDLGKLNIVAIKQCLDKLKPEYFDEYGKWSMLSKTQINLGVDEIDIVEFSKKSKKYDYKALRMIQDWISDFDEDEPYGKNEKYTEGFGQGVLFGALKKSVSEDEYKTFLKSTMFHKNKDEKYFYDNEEGMARLLQDKNKDNIVLTHNTGKEEYGYEWNEETKLFIPKTKEYFQKLFSQQIQGVLVPIINAYKSMDSEGDEEQIEMISGRITFFSKLLSSIKTAKKQASILTLAKGFLQDPILRDKEHNFESTLNPINYTIPLSGNKVIDIRTKEIRDRVKSDKFTHYIKRKFVPDTSRADAYLLELSNGNVEFKTSLLSWLGYCMIPEMIVKMVAIFIGKADTGKSGLVSSFMTDIFDWWMTSISDRILIEKKSESTHTEEYTPLRTARIGVCPELKDGDKINGSAIKRLVGSDPISVRKIFGSEDRFKFSTKVLVLTNIVPDIPDDPSLLCKLLFFQFKHVFPQSNYIEKLRKDSDFLDELFSIIINSAHSFHTEGQTLRICEEVKSYSRQTILENSSFAQWVRDRCDVGDKNDAEFRYSVSLARKDYQNWCMEEKKNYNKNEFSRNIENYNPKKAKVVNPDNTVQNTQCLFGIRKRVEESEDEGRTIQSEVGSDRPSLHSEQSSVI